MNESERSQANNTSIIALTAMAMKRDREKCIEANKASDYPPAPRKPATAAFNSSNSLTDSHDITRRASTIPCLRLEERNSPRRTREGFLIQYDNGMRESKNGGRINEGRTS